MSVSKLKLKPDITEFIVFGDKAQHKKLSSYFPVSILRKLLHPADIVGNLSVWLNTDFTLSEHVQKTCESSYLKMHDLHQITQYLIHEVAILAANGLASNHLDYYKSLLTDSTDVIYTSCSVFKILLPGIVTNHKKYAHVILILKQLHWLPGI